MRAVAPSNEHQADWLLDRLEEAAGRTLAGCRVALLGLTFKAGTDDLRESPALRIAERLVARGANGRVFDPVATEEGAAQLAAAGHDVEVSPVRGVRLRPRRRGHRGHRVAGVPAPRLGGDRRVRCAAAWWPMRATWWMSMPPPGRDCASSCLGVASPPRRPPRPPPPVGRHRPPPPRRPPPRRPVDWVDERVSGPRSRPPRWRRYANRWCAPACCRPRVFHDAAVLASRRQPVHSAWLASVASRT